MVVPLFFFCLVVYAERENTPENFLDNCRTNSTKCLGSLQDCPEGHEACRQGALQHLCGSQARQRGCKGKNTFDIKNASCLISWQKIIDKSSKL